jgi:hypothetical protein
VKAEQADLLTMTPMSCKVDLMNAVLKEDHVSPEIDTLASILASKAEFWGCLGSCKDSILAFTDYYVCESFCPQVASKWLVCFLAPAVDSELRRMLHDKLTGLLPRIASAAGSAFYGPTEYYSRQETDWKLLQLYEEVESRLEQGTSLQVMVARSLAR